MNFFRLLLPATHLVLTLECALAFFMSHVLLPLLPSPHGFLPAVQFQAARLQHHSFGLGRRVLAFL